VALPTGASLYAAYLLAFGIAALVCVAGVSRTAGIEDADTRRGLRWLLLTSAGWAAAHVAFLAAPSPSLKSASYTVGLIVGFSTVGPWLYFCSAYTGRSFHRSPAVRRLAVGVFLAVVAVKLTNPFHGLYFRTEFVTAPFPHLAVHHQLFHWLAMGLAYALASVGYFMLFELFHQVGHQKRPLLVLIGLTGLPLVLDLAGLASPLLVDMTYEPLGVAAFAAGVVFFYLEDLEAVRLTGDRDDPVIVLDDDDNRVRDYNAAAADVFPSLGVGERIDAVVPEMADSLEEDEAVISVARFGGMRYYRLSRNPFTVDDSRVGQILLLSDVTDREQYRQELERQNERLDRFASTVSHDLRNPLNVAMARLELARETDDPEHFEAITDALGRMEGIIADVLALARQGQPIDDLDQVRLSSLARESWAVVETGAADLAVDGDLTLVADPDRLQQLLENLFRNAIEHGGEAVTVRVGPVDGVGFYVEDDGPGIPPEDREEVFESGYTTARDGTGFGLAIVKEIGDAHGWSVSITEGTDGGTRFEITGVETEATEGGPVM